MKTILAFILLISSSFLNAQSEQEISVGVGPSFFGWGDIVGGSLTATYNYQFKKNIGIESRIISSAAWTYNETFSSNSSITYIQNIYFGGAISLVYTPFNGKASFFKLKSGFLLGEIIHSSGMNYELNNTYFPNYAAFQKEMLAGLIHTVHFRILNKEKYFVGTELSMLTSFFEGYYNCDGFVWNFMGGIKF